MTPKMLNIAPDPVAKAEVERELLEYARRVVVRAELVVVGKEHPGPRSALAMISRTAGETHAKGVLHAIELLQAFERLPSYGVDEWNSRRMKGATGMADDDRKRRLLKYARVVAASAEQIDGRLDHIGRMSREEARNAHKDILEAIERLQTFEKLLARKIDAA